MKTKTEKVIRKEQKTMADEKKRSENQELNEEEMGKVSGGFYVFDHDSKFPKVPPVYTTDPVKPQEQTE